MKISESNIASAKIKFLIIGYRNGYNFIRNMTTNQVSTISISHLFLLCRFSTLNTGPLMNSKVLTKTIDFQSLVKTRKKRIWVHRPTPLTKKLSFIKHRNGPSNPDTLTHPMRWLVT